MSKYKEYKERKEAMLLSPNIMREEEKQTYYLDMIAMFLSKIADTLEQIKESEA